MSRHARASAALAAAEAAVAADAGSSSTAEGDRRTGGGDDDEVARAVAFVLRSTRERPQTEAEVARKLRRRDHGDDVVAAALARARDAGALDDAAFAAAWIEDRGRQRGFGVGRLREELARRGVEPAQIEAALAGLADRDDHSTAVRLARTRLGRLPQQLEPAAKVRRLGSYLVRRGYPPGLAERAAREVLDVDDRD